MMNQVTQAKTDPRLQQITTLLGDSNAFSHDGVRLSKIDTGYLLTTEPRPNADGRWHEFYIDRFGNVTDAKTCHHGHDLGNEIVGDETSSATGDAHRNILTDDEGPKFSDVTIYLGKLAR